MFLTDTAESEKMVLADGNLQYYPQLFSDRQSAWLEQLGWRGCSYSNGIKIHDQQAMVLINDRNLKGRDVLECADKMRRDVQEHFEIQLQVEPRVFS